MAGRSQDSLVGMHRLDSQPEAPMRCTVMGLVSFKKGVLYSF